MSLFVLESASWSNSISSALSSNDRIFASGVAIKGAPGWWALHHWEPPTPPRKLTLKRSYSTANKISAPLLIDTEDIIISSGGEEYEDDLIVDESEDTDTDVKSEIRDIDDILKTVDDKETEEGDNSNTTVVPSADLKQQLLERLLMMDSSLLQDAIKKAKAKKLAEIEVAAKRKKKEEAVAAAAATAALKEEIKAKTSPLASISLPQDCIDTLDPIVSVLTKRLQMYPVIRASPYENDLLKRCHRVNYEEHKAVARLRRKLLLRRQRRRVNTALFDLDQWMYLFLKSTEMALLTNNNNNNSDKLSNDKESKPVQFPLTFDPQSIPYIADPSKSLYAKLTGMAAIYGTCPFPVTSPFSGKLLPEFIGEDAFEKCTKLKLLNELRSYFSETDDCASRVIFSKNLKSSKLVLKSELEPLTVKYTNLRKEFVGQLNDLLSDSFWPGIDVSEALDYPDYAIVALVGLSVVGCAICNTDGYLSYLYVRPDFQGCHLATSLLAILLPILSPKKDLTLHVSVTNAPAILLYQRVGFKPEEFIVNFYDKYLGIGKEDARDYSNENIDSFIGSKNAFFMRLRR